MSIATLSKLKTSLAFIREEAPELPIQQLQILVLVALNEGATPRTLERLSGMTQASVGRNVNALCKLAGRGREGLDWIEERKDPNDLRAKPLYLTAKGRAVVDQITTHLEV